MPHKLTHVMESFACFGIGWPRVKVANLVIWPVVGICAAVQFFGFMACLKGLGYALGTLFLLFCLAVFVGRGIRSGLGD